MLDRAPTAKPPFTIGQLRKAVPSHCVERSTLRSASYLGLDLFLIGVFFYFTRYIVLLESEEAAGDVVGISWALWMVYWTLQGCLSTGVWVIAHECGHHAFSDHARRFCRISPPFLSAGTVFSWKHSDRRHHSNTGSADRDEVFVPKKMEDVTLGAVMQYLQHPPSRILMIAFILLLGWPLYLVCNLSGRKYPRFASHFHPNSPIYSKREQFQVIVSDFGLLLVGFGLYGLGSVYGFLWLFKVYGVPLLIVNSFLVLITFLQHTHPSLPH